jgi:hypothetical protein
MANDVSLLRVAAARMLSALDLPGEHASQSTAARLVAIAHDFDARSALVEADAVLRAVVEDRPLTHPVNPWRMQGMNTGQRWLALARTFPSLQDCPDVTEMQLDLIAQRAGTNEREGLYGAGKGHAARFMLSLFRRSAFPAFDAAAAVSRWDAPHRAAFVEWAKDPWWP